MRTGGASVPCDDACVQKQLDEKKLKELEDEQKKKEEELRNKKELEKYEKMFQGKKKNKEKKVHNEVVQKTMFERYWFVPVIILVLIAGMNFVVL